MRTSMKSINFFASRPALRNQPPHPDSAAGCDSPSSCVNSPPISDMAFWSKSAAAESERVSSQASTSTYSWSSSNTIGAAPNRVQGTLACNEPTEPLTNRSEGNPRFAITFFFSCTLESEMSPLTTATDRFSESTFSKYADNVLVRNR